jgi:hypothetical protein
MCYYKRMLWSCGCQFGVMVTQKYEFQGTPQCRRRHLLDRLRFSVPCRAHRRRGGGGGITMDSSGGTLSGSGNNSGANCGANSSD